MGPPPINNHTSFPSLVAPTITDTSGNASTSTQTISYSKAASTDIFPKKEQAICFNIIKGTSERDYITKIGDLVKPINVRYVSRMSRDRFAIFLSDKRYVDYLVDKFPIIKVGNNEIKVRRLINPNKRIIISNISPHIPHEFIKDLLIKEYVIKFETEITFIKYGMQNISGYSHLLNAKREFYIDPEQVEKIPESHLIQYEETSYRIFFSPDSVKCFICQEIGHISKNCPNTEEDGDPNINKENNCNINTDNVHTDSWLENSNDDMSNMDEMEFEEEETKGNPDKTTQNKKRHTAPSDTSESVSSKIVPAQDETSIPMEKTQKPRPKRIKKSQPQPTSKPNVMSPGGDVAQQTSPEVNDTQQENNVQSLSDSLANIRDMFSQDNTGSGITFDQFISFFAEALKNKNPVQTAEQHQFNIPELKTLLRLIHPSLPNQSLKYNYTRFVNLLSDQN